MTGVVGVAIVEEDGTLARLILDFWMRDRSFGMKLKTSKLTKDLLYVFLFKDATKLDEHHFSVWISIKSSQARLSHLSVRMVCEISPLLQF